MRAGVGQRRALLAVHLTASIGWIGAAGAYIALAVAVARTDDPALVRAGWRGMEVVGWYAILPLAVATLLTGIALAVLTRWGLLRHYWVLVSLAGTVLATVVLLAHLPDVSAVAQRVDQTADAQLAILGSDLFHSVLGMAVLLGLMALNIIKPRGLTRYGCRREQQARAERGSRAPHPGPTGG